MKPSLQIIPLTSLHEMEQNFSLIQILTPSLSFSNYQLFLSQMIPHNYAQIIGVLQGQTVAVSGYWIATKLYCGKYLEVDNFIVHPEFQSMQIGEHMLNYMIEKATHEQCEVVMLDAYRENERAHRFYERHGFKAKGFHFVKKL